MSPLLSLHQALQQFLAKHEQALPLNELIQQVLDTANEDSLTLLACLEILRASPKEQGAMPWLTLELLLIAWSAQYRQLSKRYTLSLISQCLVSRQRSLGGKTSRPLSQIIRVSQVLGESLWEGESLGRSLGKLTRYRYLAQGLELVAQVVHYQVQFLESAPHHKLRPLPRKLLIAIRTWPENDEVFPKLVAALEQQSALSFRIREQATAQTDQHKLLSLKQALLWLGPERSRELVLVTHFETHLNWPYFPLRDALLVRRALLASFIEGLQVSLNVELPCHPDLLSYLWIYDCWYQSDWNTYITWNRKYSVHQLPLQPLDWQPVRRKARSERATKLAEYWRLPSTLKQILLLNQAPDNKRVALTELAVIMTALAFEHGGELPSQWSNEIALRMNTLGITWREVRELMNYVSTTQHAYCPFEPIPL
ncbi:MAG: hypothetical protein HLUCCO02_04575 [Idiomarinaceae bacterium HL-53]|nr:MAG: hypothetical protein HLUCCO02_04575 [Idiomarinaceae bacterium HL-53]CUS49291.1 hypothetical protein Ga0003345_2279 [Idiomarinaceae bacterium HL-53]